MPRYHSFLDVTVDTSSLDDTISEIELRLHELEGRESQDIENYLLDHDYLTRYQVQTDFASTEYAWQLEKRLEELERYNMPERMADMGVLLAELRERVDRPQFSFMRWLGSLLP